MKKLFLALLISTCYSNMQAQDYKDAIGIRISSEGAVQSQSITYRHFFNEKIAVEGLLSFGEPVVIGALLQRFTPVSSIEGLSWFYGGGAYLGFNKDYLFGTQGILGIDYKIANLPINFSIDWKPEINLVKEFSFEPAAIGVSARFVLK